MILQLILINFRYKEIHIQGVEKMNFEEMANMAKMMKIFSDSGGKTKEEQILKLFSLYAKPNEQKNVKILMKYVELENLVKKYKSRVLATGLENGSWQKNVLCELRGSVDENKKLKMDMVLKFIELNEIMKKVTSVKPN